MKRDSLDPGSQFPSARPLAAQLQENWLQQLKPAEALHGTEAHKAQVCYSSALLSALEHEPPSELSVPCQVIGKKHGGPARAGVRFLLGERNEAVLSEIPYIQFHWGEPQLLSRFSLAAGKSDHFPFLVSLLSLSLTLHSFFLSFSSVSFDTGPRPTAKSQIH